MKISIIIPVFNLENYILQTLQSCIDQNMPEDQYEIICIDDGSSDKSAEYIQNFVKSHKGVRYCHQENAGVSNARNKGMMLAQGEYIWFVDGDDLMKPNCLGQLYQEACDASADIVWFKIRNFYDKPDYSDEAKPVFEKCDNPEKIYDFMFAKGGGGVCCNLYRTEFLKENDIHFRNDIKYSEDVLFGFQAVMSARICLKTSAVFYFYRQRQGSAMHSNNHLAHIDSMKKLSFAYDDFLRHEIDERKKRIIHNKRDFAVKALLFSVMKSGDISYAKRILSELKAVGFYPYPLKRELLQGNETIKQWIINLISFFFPCELYYMICVGIFAIRRKKGL